MQSLTKICAQFKLGTTLAEKFLAQRPELKLKTGADVTYEAAMLFFFCKAYKTYQAVDCLWRTGFYEDAFLLVRTILEVYLQARYMNEAPSAHSKEFVEHDPVRWYKSFLRLPGVGAAQLVAEFEKREDFGEIKRQYEERKPLMRGMNWWGGTIESLAQHLGLPFRQAYAVEYWWQSNLVHSTATALQHYVVESDDGFDLNCHPKLGDPTLELRTAPTSATRWLICITEEVSQALSVAIEDNIQQAKQAFAEMQADS